MDRETLIIDADFSARTKNLLLGNSDQFGFSGHYSHEHRKEFALKHLEDLDVRKMRGFKGFGNRTIKEIISVCDFVGISTVGFEELSTDSDYKMISINTQTKSGKALYDLARLLQKDDGNISISNL